MAFQALVVDKDHQTVITESAAWAKRGILITMVETMHDAIIQLHMNDYIFTVINANTVNYLPMLPNLCSVSSVPVFILSATPSEHEHIKAVKGGAAAYLCLNDNAEVNIELILVLVGKQNNLENHHSGQRDLLYHGAFLVHYDYRQAFYYDAEIRSLTKTEFEILCFLVRHGGKVVSYKDIYRQIGNEYYQDEEHKILWNHILRLRKKLSKVVGDKHNIETVTGVGYRFIP